MNHHVHSVNICSVSYTHLDVYKRQNPLFILDGAHNAHGMEALVSSMPAVSNLKVIVSILQDKNLEAMLAMSLIHIFVLHPVGKG